MRLKSRIIHPFAKHISASIVKSAKQAIDDQNKIRNQLISRSKNTLFAKDHSFDKISNYKDFQNQIPIRDYEGLRTYINKVISGENDILWPGKPIYFAKTSGTTSGVKYIPISKESLPNHIDTARNALLNFAYNNKLLSIFDGHVIFLSGSPVLTEIGGIDTGRLSGIVNHEIPRWLKKNQVPSYQTNCIEDWEEKLDTIVTETLQKDMRLISGIPPWVQMYYERLLERTNKQYIKDIFPNYSIFAYGGVNFAPYKQSLENLVGKEMASFETYPASEGFIAFQDKEPSDGLLLNTNSGIFFEFCPLSEISAEKPRRLSLSEIELDVDYVLIINNNAGLWAYNIGDTLRFVSKDPYRIIVTGRVKHYISAFGEHVIAKEVEQAISEVSLDQNVRVNEFTVAPQVNPQRGEIPYHEWFIEFDKEPQDLDLFSLKLDQAMRNQNIYYDDLIVSKILQVLKISCLPKGAFQKYMKSKGKLGGQNKVPRLGNDREIVDKLLDLFTN